jgi:DNA-binding transcriptional LysR family regulator
MLDPRLKNALLDRGLKLSHLRMMAALAGTAHLGYAAQALGISQPAASRLLGEVEDICGFAVHVRVGRGVQLTEVGQALASRAVRILGELRETAREVDDFGKGSIGQVAIGAVTAPALDIVLPAVREARFAYPNIQIDVSVAPSDILFDQLLVGKLDFIIARIPQGADAAAVVAQPVATETVAFVARKSHPLAHKPQLELTELTAFDWVLPSRGNPMAEAVLARLAALGHPPPMQRMTTSSFLLTMALLQQTNAIAPLSLAVASQFTGDADKSLVQLKIDLNIAVSPYSILTRRDWSSPLAARHVLDIVSALAARTASA